MGNVARHRVAVLVPWVALVAVTAFALAQLGRHQDLGGAPEPAVPSGAPAAAPRVDDEAALPALETAAQAAEQALDQALVDLDAARKEAVGARRVAAETQARLESTEAALAVAEARLAAFEAVPETNPEPAPVPDAVEAKDPLLGWFEDAAATDPGRRAAARTAAASATPEQVVRLLLDPEAGRPHVVAVGADVLASVAVAGPVLRDGSAEVVGEVVALLAGLALDWPDAEQARLARDLAGGSDVTVPSIRAVAVLALGGAAPHLLQLCRHPDPAMRAAAAHALSRVPDREAVSAETIQLLAGLLGDDDVQVRRAALLLAEAVLGERIEAFDPAAGAAARRAQLEPILDRLGAT